MDARRLMYFIDFLGKETDGHTAELAELYRQALERDDNIIALTDCIRNYSYYGEIGRARLDEANALYRKAQEKPAEVLQTLQEIRRLVEQIHSFADAADRLICAPEPFTETISVLQNRKQVSYMAAMRQTAAACTHLIAVYAGTEPLRKLMWSELGGIQDYIQLVNFRFLPVLISVQRPTYCWVIRQHRLGGNTLFGGNAYTLTFENENTVLQQCAPLRKEPLGTHAYLNCDAFETDTADVPLCWGIGNLVSGTGENGLELLRKGVVTDIRSPNRKELAKPMPAPPLLLQTLTDGNAYCLTPDRLVSAMNQWRMGYEIETKRSRGLCLFCGKKTNGRLVCASHFSTEL